MHTDRLQVDRWKVHKTNGQIDKQITNKQANGPNTHIERKMEELMDIVIIVPCTFFSFK